MKLLGMFLVIIVLLCSCDAPPAEGQEKGSSGIVDIVKGESSLDTGKEESGSESVKIEKSTYIGTWNDSPYWASGCGDNHNFCEDGTYRLIYNSMDNSRRIYYLDGTWELTDRGIRVSIESRTILVGGQIIYDVFLGHQIEGGNLEEEKFDPPMVREYTIDDLHYDKDIDDAYYQHSEFAGEPLLTMHIGGSQFWKLDDKPILD